MVADLRSCLHRGSRSKISHWELSQLQYMRCNSGTSSSSWFHSMCARHLHEKNRQDRERASSVISMFNYSNCSTVGTFCNGQSGTRQVWHTTWQSARHSARGLWRVHPACWGCSRTGMCRESLERTPAQTSHALVHFIYHGYDLMSDGRWQLMTSLLCRIFSLYQLTYSFFNCRYSSLNHCFMSCSHF